MARVSVMGEGGNASVKVVAPAWAALFQHRPSWCNQYEASAGYEGGHYDKNPGYSRCVW